MLKYYDVKITKKWRGRIQALSQESAETEAREMLASDGKIKFKAKPAKEKKSKEKTSATSES